MSEIQIQQHVAQDDEVSLKEVILKIKDWMIFLKTKWIVIFFFGVVGAAIGYINAYRQKPIYTATLSFALEEDKSGGVGFAGAMGLASSLGIDLGTSAGGAFTGANLIQLMKSRTLVEKALLNPITVNNKKLSFAAYFVSFNQIDKEWGKDPMLRNVRFEPLADRAKFTLQQDSVLGTLYSRMTGENGMLTVSQKDKKIGIISIEVKASDELFAKAFTESVAKEVSEFYVETKSKKAKMNVSILQKQADSIRNELNAAITGVASSVDNTFNLNPALNIKRIPSTKRQIDVQANTAILTQLVTNVEMAKVTLLKETPLIQVIDRPILPLKKERPSKLMGLLKGGILAGILIVIILIGRRVLIKLMKE